MFLTDYFRTERSAIETWRMADRTTRLRDFKPVKIRQMLDQRDGFTTKKRAELYEMFSELAAHASMAGIQMLRPKGDDIYIGPFFDVTALHATICEMGRLSAQIGEVTGSFVPAEWPLGKTALTAFNQTKIAWLKRFYPSSL